MDRIYILSDVFDKRMFDVVVSKESGDGYIESKIPGHKPERILLLNFIKRINEKMGFDFITINTTEL